MAKQKPKKQPKAFDVHRTLPANPRQSSEYRHTRQPKPSETLAPKLVSNKRRFMWKRLFASVILGAFLFVLFIAVWDARNASHASAKMFGSGNLTELLTPTTLKGSDQG